MAHRWYEPSGDSVVFGLRCKSFINQLLSTLDINYFIDELTDEENLAAYYEETFIIDDIDLTVSSTGDMLIFTLHDIDQNILEKSIRPSELSKYIVGINIINSVGAGKKGTQEMFLM